MPTVAEIERLQALIGRLTPLSTKQRGEVIAADDWNLLVGALIEVGRAALTVGEADTVPTHEHADQVGIGWLDPRVRQLVTGGGVKDPAVETEFIKLRRDLGGLTTRVDRVGADVVRSRTQLDEVATNDLAREALLSHLNRKVLGAADDRGDIADLRSTLRTVQAEVGRAVEVGTRLEENGQPIDVPGLVARVAAVESLRDRLTRPDGELLDASALEVRLLELQTSLVTQEELTEAVDDVRGGRGELDLDAVLDASRLAARETATGQVQLLAGGLRSEIDTRLGAIGPAVSAEVDRAAGSLRGELLAAARAEVADAVGTGDDAVRAELSDLVEQRFATTTAVLEERLGDVSALVERQVTSQLDDQLSNALQDVRGRIQELQGSVTRLGEEIRDHRTVVADLELRSEVARREDAAARTRLRAEMLERIDAVEGRVDPRIATRVDEARTILRTDLEATVAASRRDLEVRLAEVARQSAATEVQLLSTGIRTDVTSIIRQEVDANLTAVRGEISAELAGLQQRVAGMVTTEVGRATADIPRLVTAEVEAFRPEIIRRTGVTRPPIG